jgi:hypothetical protein
MSQERISVAENPNYSRFNLKTLKKIASAFDVALIVRFVPISELVEWELKLSSEALEAISYDQDPYFREITEPNSIMKFLEPEPQSFIAHGGFTFGGEGKFEVFYPFQTPEKKVTDLNDYRRTREQFKKEIETSLQKVMIGATQ